MVPFDADDDDYDISVHNVVCVVNLDCEINLRQVAENGFNIEHRGGKVTIKLRKPRVCAHVWSSGKICCSGATTEEEAFLGTRRVARIVQRAGFDVKLREMRIVNVMATCNLPFRVRLRNFALHCPEVSYEPELHRAASCKVPELKAHLNVFASGSVTILASSVDNVHKAVEHIYPQVERFSVALTAADEEALAKKRLLAQRRRIFGYN